MGWVFLVVAGVLEIVWAVALKQSRGFTHFGWSAVTVAGLVASVVLLGKAVRTLPLGTAYAVWVGIGAVGTALVATFALRESMTASRLGFLAMLLAAIVGLKVTTPSTVD